MSRIDTSHDDIRTPDEEPASTFAVSNSIDDDLAGSASAANKNLLARNGGMILLLIVVAVAGALLLGMRKLGLAGRLELVDIKIDYPFETRKDAVVGPDHQNVINDLKSSADVVQVPPELVQMNPFEWKAESNRSDDGDLAVREAERLRKAKETRQREIDRALASLRLNSIMGGRIPVAQISGQLVRVGDTVGEFFKVTGIEGRSVHLEVDGRKHELTLGE